MINPDRSEASTAFAALDVSQVKRAAALGVSRKTIQNLEKGSKPLPELSKRIAKLYGIAEHLWFAPIDAPPVLPARGAKPVAPPPALPTTMLEGMREARAQGLTDSELLPANQIELRALATRIDDALDELTDRERVICHVGFRGMRERLLELLAVEPSLHDAAALALPAPDAAGAVAKLRVCRQELDALQKDIQAAAQARMQLGNVQRAARFDAQATTAARLAKRATLDGSNLKDLFASKTWRQVVRDLGVVMRKDLEALECSKEVLEPIDEPFAREMLRELRELSQITWPCERFQKDIEGFFYLILGCDPWSRQRELILNVQDNDWVAVASGHRVSKSYSVAGVALWFYCSFPNARVFITAPTDRQLNEIVWRELSMRVAASGVCFACREENKTRDQRDQISAPCNHSAKIEGYIKETAKGGMKSEDFRQIQGFTAKDAESAAGLAGENMMFIVEEASGVGASIFLALKGNLAGGGKLFLVGNPTQNDGEFFDAFFAKKKSKQVEGEASVGNYVTMNISSWESPNVEAGRVVIKGLATREWCEARKLEWGEDSAQYKIRVLGQHALGEDGKLFPVALIVAAEERWEETSDDGELYIGIDPAGPTGTGDESAFSVRRGLKVLQNYAKRGLDEDGHLSEVLSILAVHRRPGEVATVNVDSEGVGAGIVSRFRQYQESNVNVLRVFAVRASSNAQREPQIYDRWRDELAGNLARWLRAGGAIPTDLKLSAELHVFELKMRTLANKGERSKLTPKEEVIKKLHRSPDRYDALALCVWDQPETDDLPAVRSPGNQREQGQGLDPYGGSAASGGAIDPYG